MEPEEQLETFTYSEVKQGREHFYRVTANEDRYIIEKDGSILAQLICDVIWKQISGKPLDNKLIGQLGDRIEDYYC